MSQTVESQLSQQLVIYRSVSTITTRAVTRVMIMAALFAKETESVSIKTSCSITEFYVILHVVLKTKVKDRRV